jgi:DNA-binding beta-propeller fold protein YncE
VDTESLSVVARQWGGDQPTGLAVSPDGRRVVFSDFLDARLEVYDASAR